MMYMLRLIYLLMNADVTEDDVRGKDHLRHLGSKNGKCTTIYDNIIQSILYSILKG